jgi:hypothetical protein
MLHDDVVHNTRAQYMAELESLQQLSIKDYGDTPFLTPGDVVLLTS